MCKKNEINWTVAYGQSLRINKRVKNNDLNYNIVKETDQ